MPGKRNLFDRLRNAFSSMRRHKLRYTMIFTNALLTILTVLLLSGLSYRIYSRNLAQTVSDSVDMLFGQINRGLDEYLGGIDAISKSLFFNKSLQQDLETDAEDTYRKVQRVGDQMAAGLELNESIRGICFLSTRDGTFYATPDLPGGLLERLTALVGEVPEDGRMVILPVSLAAPGGGSTYYCAARLVKSLTEDRYFDPTGIGVIVLKPDSIANVMRNGSMDKRFRVSLFDRDGHLLPTGTAGEEALPQALIHDLVAGSLGDNPSVAGEPSLVRAMTVQRTGWRLVARIPLNELFPERAWLRMTTLLVALAVLLFAVLLNLLFNLVVTRPIDRLAVAFDQVAAGDFKARVRFRWRNEVTALADSFNNMVSEIGSLTRRIFDTQQRLYETELEKKQHEFNGLQTQINSHFLYNTLHCLVGMSTTGARAELAQVVEHLSAFLRYGTRAAREVTLQEELAHLEHYLTIQRLRFGDRIRVRIEVRGDPNRCRVLKLLLQPLVENAIFHGLETRTGRGLVKVVVDAGEERVRIRVLDNGAGMSPETLAGLRASLGATDWQDSGAGGHGLGLLNIHRRLRLYHGDACTMQIASRAGLGTAVTVTLPATGMQPDGEMPRQ